MTRRVSDTMSHHFRRNSSHGQNEKSRLSNGNSRHHPYDRSPPSSSHRGGAQHEIRAPQVRQLNSDRRSPSRVSHGRPQTDARHEAPQSRHVNSERPPSSNVTRGGAQQDAHREVSQSRQVNSDRTPSNVSCGEAQPDAHREAPQNRQQNSHLAKLFRTPATVRLNDEDASVICLGERPSPWLKQHSAPVSRAQASIPSTREASGFSSPGQAVQNIQQIPAGNRSIVPTPVSNGVPNSHASAESHGTLPTHSLKIPPFPGGSNTSTQPNKRPQSARSPSLMDSLVEQRSAHLSHSVTGNGNQNYLQAGDVSEAAACQRSNLSPVASSPASSYTSNSGIPSTSTEALITTTHHGDVSKSPRQPCPSYASPPSQEHTSHRQTPANQIQTAESASTAGSSASTRTTTSTSADISRDIEKLLDVLTSAIRRNLRGRIKKHYQKPRDKETVKKILTNAVHAIRDDRSCFKDIVTLYKALDPYHYKEVIEENWVKIEKRRQEKLHEEEMAKTVKELEELEEQLKQLRAKYGYQEDSWSKEVKCTVNPIVERFLTVYRKYKDMVGEGCFVRNTAHANLLKFISLEGVTPYPEINEAVQFYVNTVKEEYFKGESLEYDHICTPLHDDIQTQVRIAAETHQIVLTDEAEHVVVKSLMGSIVKQTKAARMADTWKEILEHAHIDIADEHSLLIAFDNDPAENDPEMREQLEKNKEIGEGNMCAIIEKYARLSQAAPSGNDSDGSEETEAAGLEDEDSFNLDQLIGTCGNSGDWSEKDAVVPFENIEGQMSVMFQETDSDAENQFDPGHSNNAMRTPPFTVEYHQAETDADTEDED